MAGNVCININPYLVYPASVEVVGVGEDTSMNSIYWLCTNCERGERVGVVRGFISTPDVCPCGNHRYFLAEAYDTSGRYYPSRLPETDSD